MDRRLKKDVFQWDIRTWSPAADLWKPYLGSNGLALAIGEREGGLSLWLAKHGYTVQCTDLREFPDETRKLHDRHGVSDRITYAHQDVTSLTYDDAKFDMVMFKSVIGALSTKENQQKAIHEMHRVLKPGGVLLFAENLEGTMLHRSLRKRFVRWDSYWRYLKYRKDLDLFADFSKVEYRYYGCLASFGRSEKARSRMAALDSGMEFIIPRSWRYVLAGACVK